MIPFKQLLAEISSKKLNAYIEGAIHDQMAVAATKMTDPEHGKNLKKFATDADARKHIDKRGRGIERAEDALARKRAINSLYSRLGIKPIK